MPWGETSIVKMENPLESNDGPILWIRPGEQMLPTAELNANRSPIKRKRTGINELRVSCNQYLYVKIHNNDKYFHLLVSIRTCNIYRDL